MNKLPCPSRQFGATLISLFLCFGSALAQQAPGKQGAAQAAAQTVPAAMVVRPGEYFTEAQRRAIQEAASNLKCNTLPRVRCQDAKQNFLPTTSA